MLTKFVLRIFRLDLRCFQPSFAATKLSKGSLFRSRYSEQQKYMIFRRFRPYLGYLGISISKMASYTDAYLRLMFIV